MLFRSFGFHCASAPSAQISQIAIEQYVAVREDMDPGARAQCLSELGNGLQAEPRLSRAQDHRCDQHMQPVDGVEFVKRLRSAGFFGTNKIPTIFLTTYATEDFVRKARDLEVDGYLVKPVTRTHLEQRIAKILGDPRRIAPGSSPVR